MSDEIIDRHDEDVEDETAGEKTVAPLVYNITSYGADYDVAGLVNRMRKDDIIIPSFQRAFVWKEEDASSFIESLLLGLPVPGIFLANERETNKLLVIDGQQRLRSLQFFYDGFFDPKPEDKKKKVFHLVQVQPQFQDATYQSLSPKDKRRLDDSILHATIIKQEVPKDGDTSIYHIFRRLNASGMILKPQEVRRAAFHGTLLDAIKTLNEYETWRRIFGNKSKRLKDEELILRFLALFYGAKEYRKPMEEFLNTFVSINQNPAKEFLKKVTDLFATTIASIEKASIERPFRIIRGINAAVFDSTMVGVARRLEKGPIKGHAELKSAYLDLMQNSEYKKAVSESTSDESTVLFRLNLATDVFAEIG